jgi:hypothetical protein
MVVNTVPGAAVELEEIKRFKRIINKQLTKQNTPCPGRQHGEDCNATPMLLKAAAMAANGEDKLKGVPAVKPWTLAFNWDARIVSSAPMR